MNYLQLGFNQNMQRDLYSKPQEVSGLDFDAIVENLEGYKITPSGAFNTQDSHTQFDLDRNFLSVSQGDETLVKLGMLKEGRYGFESKIGAFFLNDEQGDPIIDQDGVNTSSLYELKTAQLNWQAIPTAVEDWVQPRGLSFTFSLSKKSLVLLNLHMQFYLWSVGTYRSRSRFLIDGVGKDESETITTTDSFYPVTKVLQLILDPGSHTISVEVKKEWVVGGAPDELAISRAEFSCLIL